MNADLVVRHNPAASRYETEVDGHLALAEYAEEGDRIVFTHTYVPPELRSRGIAEKLVRAVLEEAAVGEYGPGIERNGGGRPDHHFW